MPLIARARLTPQDTNQRQQSDSLSHNQCQRPHLGECDAESTWVEAEPSTEMTYCAIPINRPPTILTALDSHGYIF